MTKGWTKKIMQLMAVLLALWLIVAVIVIALVEMSWFAEVGYLPVLLKRLSCQILLWGCISGISAGFLLFNLALAQRQQWPWKLVAQPSSAAPEKVLSPQTPPIRLGLLLLMVTGCCLVIGWMLFSGGVIAHDVWQSDFGIRRASLPVPEQFRLIDFIREQGVDSALLLRQGGIALGMVLFVLLRPHFWLRAIAVTMSLILGGLFAGQWARFLLALNAVSFSQTDAQFGRDISFYIFHLPIWQLLDYWLGSLMTYGLMACGLMYLLSADSLSQGKFPGFSRPQLRHLYGLASGLMLTIALHHWLERYELLYSERGVVFGAGYTDVKVQLPVEAILTAVSLISAGWLFNKAIAHHRWLSLHRDDPNERKISNRRRFAFIWVPFAAYVLAYGLGYVTIEVAQRVEVQPNELVRERPFIERSIAATRMGFGLSNVEVKTFDPKDELTFRALQDNALTIDNIRLWDTRPILQTNRQLQQIRLYYQFPGADIDRYTLKFDSKRPFVLKQTLPDGHSESIKEQVIISARELDYEAVPDLAKTWVNEHLVYTHGYGFTLSTVNQVDSRGLPYYLVKDIGTADDPGALVTSSPEVRQSIPIKNPRLYFGELTTNYIMAPTSVQELDFPSGDENVYYNYQGSGGIAINTFWRRGLFAAYFRDLRVLFTEDFTPDTRVLMRRDITRRIQAIAPFLRYDSDPYLVVANKEGGPLEPAGNYLYWIIDAYTTSDRLPYSDPGERTFNYIRNSVKVIVNAFNGDVSLYIADDSDPIIEAWQRQFPELFHPLDDLALTLRSHIRYPEDLFEVQSEQLLTYHMTDPQVFYNREDQWEIPEEIYRGEYQPVAPYYLIMKLPTESREEFILLHPYTPTSRPNLIAWLAGRSDGANYGKLLLYQFPKQRLIYGPDQVEALINQDPIISQQISLWNRAGSSAVQGNLLVIPIEQSLLYVEPIYLEAEENSVPTLARVIVVYENNIVMAATLDEALESIFGDRPSPTVIKNEIGFPLPNQDPDGAITEPSETAEPTNIPTPEN